MSTVRELRDQARELGIANRQKLRKAELLAAIGEALERLGARPVSSASVIHSAAAPEPVPEPPRRPARKHPHTGVGPLLAPLVLPELPSAYDTRLLAVLPKHATGAVVVWSLTVSDLARLPVLRVFGETGLICTVPVGERLGRRYVGDLRPDQAVWAEIVSAEGDPLAIARRVALPPSTPSRLHHPLRVRIDVDRPLAHLPRDLRAAAPSAPPRPTGRPTASERSWIRATTTPVPNAAPVVAEPSEPPAVIGEHHAELVSSFVHALGGR